MAETQQNSCKIVVLGTFQWELVVASFGLYYSQFSDLYKYIKIIYLKNLLLFSLFVQNHYYQPMFTMIGGGMKNLSQSYNKMAKILPKNAKWIKDEAVRFGPKENIVVTKEGHTINYDILIVAVGLQLNYEKVYNKWLIFQFHMWSKLVIGR